MESSSFYDNEYEQLVSLEMPDPGIWRLGRLINMMMNTQVTIALDPRALAPQDKMYIPAIIAKPTPKEEKRTVIPAGIKVYDVVFTSNSKNPATVTINKEVLNDPVVSITPEDKAVLESHLSIPKPCHVPDDEAFGAMVRGGDFPTLFVDDLRGEYLTRFVEWYLSAPTVPHIIDQTSLCDDPPRQLIENLDHGFTEPPEPGLPNYQMVSSEDASVSAVMKAVEVVELSELIPTFVVLNEDNKERVESGIRTVLNDLCPSKAAEKDVLFSEDRSANGSTRDGESGYIVDCSLRPACFPRHGRDSLGDSWASHVKHGNLAGAAHILSFTGPNYNPQLMRDILELAKQFAIKVSPPPNLMDPYCFISFQRGIETNDQVGFIVRMRVEMLRYSAAMKMRQRLKVPLLANTGWMKQFIFLMYGITPLSDYVCDSAEAEDRYKDWDFCVSNGDDCWKDAPKDPPKIRRRSRLFEPEEEKDLEKGPLSRPHAVIRRSGYSWVQDTVKFASVKFGFRPKGD